MKVQKVRLKFMLMHISLWVEIDCS